MCEIVIRSSENLKTNKTFREILEQNILEQAGENLEISIQRSFAYGTLVRLRYIPRD